MFEPCWRGSGPFVREENRGAHKRNARRRPRVPVSGPHFAFCVDIWDATGDSIVEHVAGIDDFEVTEATHRAPRRASPAARITLRQGIRVLYESA
jgi:hypothetical protein